MGRFFWFGLLLLLPSAVPASVGGKIVPNHRHDIWDAAGGFPGGYVYSITQTGDGYLWIGTSKGLLRYDGLTFAFIRKRDSTSETQFPVPGLVADSTDQLWAIDDHTHLFRQSGGLLEGPLPDNGLHRVRTTSVGKTREGWPLFVSESQGLVEYEHGAAHLLLDPTLIPNVPTAVAQTADGIFWIGTREMGVFRFSAGAQELQRIPGLTDSKINCLLPIAGSTLLIGTDKGLFSLHNGKLTRQPRQEVSGEILALANGQEGDVWIGIDGDVYKAQAKDIDADGKIHALDHFSVRGTVGALFVDRDGNLWIGGPETIERYRDSAFSTYLSSAGLPCSNCGAIYVDAQQRLWFAPWDGGLFRLAHGQIQAIEVAGLRDDTVYSISGGANDEVWVARKYGGITRLSLQGDALQASTYKGKDGLAKGAVYSIYRAPDRTMWAGTLNEGLSEFRAGRWQTFTTRDGLPSNTISAITGNAAGEIFAGTPNGLAVLKNGHWVAYMTHNGLPPGAIESLLLDSADTLWIGTSKGISFLRSGSLHVPLGAPSALYGEILSIAENKGWLWITTDDHVLRVRCAALLNQSFREGDYREFGVAEGLPSVAGVKRNSSVVLDNRGRLWFSLNQGISVLQPSAFGRPAFPVTVRLEEILVDGRLMGSGNTIRIPSGRHRITLRYAGVNVSNSEDVRYRYRLDDVDSSWSAPTALREIDYTNIPPGRFRFQVTARNPDGVWSGHGTALTFEVEPTYTQTRWFRALCAAAFLGLLWGLYQLRVQQLKREERKLREVIETIPTFAWTALPDGSVDFVNRHWQEYTGLSAEKTIGWGWQAAVQPEDLERHAATWRASLASGEPVESEVRYRRAADGQYRWFLTRAVPIRDGRGKIVKWYGTSTDIEDRKRAERLQADLGHVNRVSTMGELTASLAHEIKQPIGAAVTNADVCARLLDRDQPDIPEARVAALEMVKDARRAARIIDRVRSLYRKGSSQMDAVDMNEIIGEMLLLLHNEANGHSVNIRTEIAGGLPKVMADRVQIQQVLMNLMLNGIQAMGETGGVLTIKARLDQDGRVLISVSDTGVGLPADKADQIFNAFFTTKTDGSGMGLAISCSIIESHRGRLWATSNAGKGATFCFTLPTAAQAVQRASGPRVASR